MKKINNKGFTLVELLAVLVILIAILTIAIPSITSSLERSKAKQLKAKQDLLVSLADIYVSENRNTVTQNCYLELAKLKSVGATEDDLLDANGNEMVGYIYCDIRNNKIYYTDASPSSSDNICP